MTNETPSPEHGTAPGRPSDQPAESRPPATRADLERFPERSETREVRLLPDSESTDRTGGPLYVPADPTPPPGPSPVIAPPGPEASPPNVEPELELLEQIGSGGMGTVWRARQKHLDRIVAVKVIRDCGADQEARARFLSEGKNQARLSHPGICSVFDLRESRGVFYIVMEYVEGKSLEELLKAQKKFPPPRVARIGAQMTEPIEYAAHEGIIHRDLKPANVMLTEGGKIKIIDFGLAVLAENLFGPRFTQKGDLLGTPAFMSPEQLNQEVKLDHRSDIYSLSVLLYTLSTGRPPFVGRDFACTLRNVLLTEPTPLPAVEPDYPAGLWEVLRKGMAKDPKDRWQDWASYREALLPFAEEPAGTPAVGLGAAQGPGASAAPPSVLARIRRRPFPAALALGFILALGLAIGWRLHSGSGSHPLADLKEGGNREPNPSKREKASQPATPAHETAAKEKEPETPKPTVKPKTELGPAPEAISKAEPPAPRLREKLFKWTPTERAQSAVADIVRCFADHRTDLAAYSFDGVVRDLETLEDLSQKAAPSDSSPEEREYVAAHLEQAIALARLARSTVAERLGELQKGNEVISLRLRKGSPISGKVVDAGSGSLTLSDDKGNPRSVGLGEIAPDEFLSKASSPAAQAALLALASEPALALRKVLELSDSSDELLLWIPVILRLGRLGIVESAREVAKEAAAPLLSRQPLEGQDGLLPKLARLDQAAKILLGERARILEFYPYLPADIEIASREKEALGLLVNGAFSKVLGGFPKTAAYPIAGQVLVRQFTVELAGSCQEMLADGAWYDLQWKIVPPVRDLPKPEDYFVPGYKERPLLFRDPAGLRKLVLGKIGLRVEEGVLLTLAWKPYGNDLPRSHWEFLLRGRERSENFLRVDDDAVALCRSVLTPGAKDIVLCSAALPQAPVEKKYQTFVLLPGDDFLHVFVDGEIVLSIPREDASIPKQLSFHVYSGEALVKSMQAKRAPDSVQEGRK